MQNTTPPFPEALYMSVDYADGSADGSACSTMSKVAVMETLMLTRGTTLPCPFPRCFILVVLGGTGVASEAGILHSDVGGLSFLLHHTHQPPATICTSASIFPFPSSATDKSLAFFRGPENRILFSTPLHLACAENPVFKRSWRPYGAFTETMTGSS